MRDVKELGYHDPTSGGREAEAAELILSVVTNH